ncbi:MAG: acetate--CoA ligase [Deltaproteobacteria bacterium]|nr:acetate--CoA ligase [Candidatus Anaeroferrophillus wilburensis]MBN2888351.1 acetate--CoA ligase [Deltaproteobacteria bacterium]
MAEATELKKVYPVPEEFRKKAFFKSREEYQKLYDESINNNDAFWARIAEEYVTWFKKWDQVQDWKFSKDEVYLKWFVGGKLNVSYNCLDRHLEKRGDQVAIIWEGNEPTVDRKYTYKQLHEQVCKFANVMKAHGIKKGDKVTIYLPMIPELAVAMLACTRIGAIHSIVFGGFSADALKDRIQDCESTFLISCNGYYRGAKIINQKANVDAAVAMCPTIKNTVIVRHEELDVPMNAVDLWWDEEMAKVDANCEPEWMDAEDPLFFLYTSGSTGKPKGVIHTTGGYLVYTSFTHKNIFDYHDGDIYFCAADIGWVTGHSYIVYGPLCNGATSVMFEGVPNYPDAGRYWDIIGKHKINTLYTAPTAIRAIAGQGESYVTSRLDKLDSLTLLGTVGEPINPEAWKWYFELPGRSKCPIVDTWWQTETGGILITGLPGAIDMKPGYATTPFFGCDPLIVDPATGVEIKGPGEGALCIRRPWPGLMRGVYGDPERFKMTYFVQYDGYYFTGDGAMREDNGDYRLMGRIDDVINVSGHRMGTAEVESALVLHDKVAEAAVVGMPHDVKGQGIYAYVTLNAGVEGNDALKKELVNLVRKEIGPIASPDMIQWAPALPKTRSGKIMRRILRKIAANEVDPKGFGDTSTLADPSVVQSLVDTRENRG